MGEQVVVVGAGPAGIASALALKDAGLSPVLLEGSEQIASSWRGRYERLRLNTCRIGSHLPGRKFAKGTPLFPTREDLIRHLERGASEDGIEVRLSTPVERIERADGGWSALTPAGAVEARQLVVATGHDRVPFTPDWPGRDAFAGELLHAAEYRNPEPFRGRRILVVGAGCTGIELSYDLAENGAAKVWMAVRNPPNITLRSGPGGIPGDLIGAALIHAPIRFADRFERFGRKMDFGDLSEYGLPIPEEGLFTQFHRKGTVPTIVDPEMIEAVKAGDIEVVAAVTELDAGGVTLADGSRLEPDVVLCATGYRRGLEPMVGHLDVLDDRGEPRALAEDAAAPGLRFVGFITRPGALGYMRKQARRAARAIKRELVSAPA